MQSTSKNVNPTSEKSTDASQVSVIGSERRKNPQGLLFPQKKDRFWQWMAIIMFLAMAVAAGMVALDEHDEKIVREKMHEQFMARCLRNYPEYRCTILWASYMQGEQVE